MNQSSVRSARLKNTHERSKGLSIAEVMVAFVILAMGFMVWTKTSQLAIKDTKTGNTNFDVLLEHQTNFEILQSIPWAKVALAAYCPVGHPWAVVSRDSATISYANKTATGTADLSKICSPFVPPVTKSAHYQNYQSNISDLRKAIFQWPYEGASANAREIQPTLDPAYFASNIAPKLSAAGCMNCHAGTNYNMNGPQALGHPALSRQAMITQAPHIMNLNFSNYAQLTGPTTYTDISGRSSTTGQRTDAPNNFKLHPLAAPMMLASKLGQTVMGPTMVFNGLAADRKPGQTLVNRVDFFATANHELSNHIVAPLPDPKPLVEKNDPYYIKPWTRTHRRITVPYTNRNCPTELVGKVPLGNSLAQCLPGEIFQPGSCFSSVGAWIPPRISCDKKGKCKAKSPGPQLAGCNSGGENVCCSATAGCPSSFQLDWDCLTNQPSSMESLVINPKLPSEFVNGIPFPQIVPFSSSGLGQIIPNNNCSDQFLTKSGCSPANVKDNSCRIRCSAPTWHKPGYGKKGSGPAEQSGCLEALVTFTCKTAPTVPSKTNMPTIQHASTAVFEVHFTLTTTIFDAQTPSNQKSMTSMGVPK